MEEISQLSSNEMPGAKLCQCVCSQICNKAKQAAVFGFSSCPCDAVAVFTGEKDSIPCRADHS